MSLHPEIKQNWIDALRSGKWKQGLPSLWVDRSGGYCPVAILNELHGGNLQCLTHALEAGLDFVSMTQIFELHRNSKTFSEIADWIEENL